MPRSQRYHQVMAHIAALQQRYQTLSQQMNVGLYRIEMANLRRVSRTTGRLVPLYTEREYDDHTLPTRILPPIDNANEDRSGIPSPVFGSWY